MVNAIVGIEFHHGCLAVGERGAEQTPEAVLAEARGASVVLLEGLGDASNVGAISRSALAFGAGAALLSPGTADPLYRKAIRVSAGAAVVLPFARLDDWPRDLERLRDGGYTLLALTPRAEAVDISALGTSCPRPARVALLLGTEGRGLSAAALAAADLQGRIPMAPEVDSLNVAAAGAAAPAPSARAAVRARALARDRRPGAHADRSGRHARSEPRHGQEVPVPRRRPGLCPPVATRAGPLRRRHELRTAGPRRGGAG